MSDDSLNIKVCLPKVIKTAKRESFSSYTITRAVAVRGKYWDKGYTLKIHFMNGSDEQIASMKDTIEEILAPINLYHVYVDDPVGSDIRIAFNEGYGSYSYLGTDSRFIPPEYETLNIGWHGKNVERHEFCHALNLAHEHQNPDGGIQWNVPKILEDMSGPPNYWTEAEIYDNIINAYSLEEVDTTKFDPDSIMLYYFPPEWVLNGIEPNENLFLSATDEQFLKDAYGEIDTMAPVITIHGDEQMVLKYGEPYIELGASAIDNKDGDISTSIQIIGDVDSEEPGVHPVLYSVHDKAGNHAEKVRNVLVEEPETAEPPVDEPTGSEEPPVDTPEEPPVDEPTEPTTPEEPSEPEVPTVPEPPVEEKKSKTGLYIGIAIAVVVIAIILFSVL